MNVNITIFNLLVTLLMKKVLLISLAAMLAAPTFAQDQIGDDCTKYIANAGFDEEI